MHEYIFHFLDVYTRPPLAQGCLRGRGDKVPNPDDHPSRSSHKLYKRVIYSVWIGTLNAMNLGVKQKYASRN